MAQKKNPLLGATRAAVLTVSMYQECSVQNNKDCTRTAEVRSK